MSAALPEVSLAYGSATQAQQPSPAPAQAYPEVALSYGTGGAGYAATQHIEVLGYTCPGSAQPGQPISFCVDVRCNDSNGCPATLILVPPEGAEQTKSVHLPPGESQQCITVYAPSQPGTYNYTLELRDDYYNEIVLDKQCQVQVIAQPAAPQPAPAQPSSTGSSLGVALLLALLALVAYMYAYGGREEYG